MKTLYLIDGYAQFFRAFHAIRTPMSSPVTKEPTNATFGFVGMLIKLLREYGPDSVAVAIDVSGDKEGYRSELYAAYKATRDEPPEGFREQVARCLSILEAMGVPVLGVERFEADDVIATVCEQLSDDDGTLIRLVSKDKDLQQLLAEGRVEMEDVHTGDRITESTLMEAKGVAPGQVGDMLALMGDAVDNIPGVPGIGEKTAAKLIAEFGTLGAVIEEAKNEKGKIKGKRQENIRAFADKLPLSRELVELRRDVPVELDLEAASVSRIDLEALLPILKELGFNRYQDEVKALIESRGGDAAAAEQKAKRAGTSSFAAGLFEQEQEEDGEPGAARSRPTSCVDTAGYACVRTESELAALVEALSGATLLAIDTETTGLRATECALCGLSFAVWEGGSVRAWYVPVRSPESDEHLDARAVLGALRPILEGSDHTKTGHNLKFDMLVLRNAPLLDDVEPVCLRGAVFDTMVADYLVDASRSSHKMDHLALALLGHTCTPIEELIGKGRHQKSFDRVPLEEASPYACEDADVSLRLHAVLSAQIDEMGLRDLFDEVELPLIDVLAELEHNGIAVDPSELDRQAKRLEKRIMDLRDEIVEASPRDFSPDSPKQLAEVLFNPPDASPTGLGIKPVKKTKTGYSTDVETLEKLAGDPSIGSPIPALIVEYRQLTKLVSTYLVALKEAISERDGRIHASFNQTVAATGRLSSSDPNLQNIPIRTEIGRQIRKAFVAPAGRVLIGADYSQIELRLLAHLSQDGALIEAFEAGADIHRAVAAQIHGVGEDEVTREQREGAKMVNFGIIYGITPFGLARRLGVSKGEASEIIDGYKARFPGISTFLEECVAFAREHGYVETILKRRRPIDGIDSRNNQKQSLAERMAINSVVQGSAADLIKVAMIRLQAAIAGSVEADPLAGALLLLQIHDELVLESDADRAEAVGGVMVEQMRGAMALRVPLVVEVSAGRDWFAAK